MHKINKLSRSEVHNTHCKSVIDDALDSCGVLDFTVPLWLDDALEYTSTD